MPDLKKIKRFLQNLLDIHFENQYNLHLILGASSLGEVDLRRAGKLTFNQGVR
jgi:hypothetical protein